MVARTRHKKALGICNVVGAHQRACAIGPKLTQVKFMGIWARLGPERRFLGDEIKRYGVNCFVAVSLSLRRSLLQVT